MIYPGREHAVHRRDRGRVRRGSRWAASPPSSLASHHVVYIHYEEGDPGLDASSATTAAASSAAAIAQRLRFRGATDRPAPGRLECRCRCWTRAPALVVQDGVNEAMSLHGADIMGADGAATFRRRLRDAFLRAGAASIACDRLLKGRDARCRDAHGSVHKGNALNGARILLENVEPFGHGLRGVSYVFSHEGSPRSSARQRAAHQDPVKVLPRLGLRAIPPDLSRFGEAAVQPGPQARSGKRCWR